MNYPPQPATDWATRPGRHIVSLSGGKDSTALAIYLRDYIPQLEYVFCDTHKELPETSSARPWMPRTTR
jgi:3'-phosphoadenosine 5'-phosphosulfate sulfotransferase (PAPS reductase)/FAD synthetase